MNEIESESEGELGEERPLDDEITVKGKSRVDWLEVAATVLLGIASVLIAWSTYQSQLWGGVQDTHNTASTLMIVDAADDMGRGDATKSLDQLLFADWFLDFEADDFRLGQMSDQGQVASDRWLSNNEVRPFDSVAYIYDKRIYGDGLAKFEASKALFESASKANGNSDNYVFSATIIALVLFLAGVSLVLKGRLTRLILVASSGLIIAIVAVILADLPYAGDAKEKKEQIEREVKEAAFAEFAVKIEQEEQADALVAADVAADDALGELVTDWGAFTPTRGDTAFALYWDVIEISDSSGDLDEDFAETIKLLNDVGIPFSVAALDCDEGAFEGLGLELGEYDAVATYFQSMEDAEQFSRDLELDVDSIVQVTTFCVD